MNIIMYFIRYNNNPKEKRTGDCIIRALALALNKSWKEVYTDLFNLSIKMSLIVTDPKVFKKYLKDLGYMQEKMPKTLDNKRYTVEEFIDDIAHKNMTYIISIAKHVTVIKDKKLYDTWDCSHKCVGNYWII